MTERINVGRVAAFLALAIAVILVGWLILGRGGGHTYNLRFQTAGQLVNGNEVLIGGQSVGTVKSIELTDDNQAEVKIDVDQELHAGTTAIVRSTSLSGVANRYVSLFPGPNSEPALHDDAHISADKTTTPVDLDQLFNTFDERTRTALQDVVAGSAELYKGVGPEANETYKYLSPALASTDRLVSELTRDREVFTDFLVDTSRTVTALGERRNDLTGLVSNTNQTMEAIGSEQEALDDTLGVLPDTLRQGNTTFVNLRATLDDLDVLVAASKPATKDLTPFLRRLRPVVHRAVPTFADLRPIMLRKGSGNDLRETMRQLPTLRARATTAFPNSINALQKTQPVLEFARPYTPDLTGFISKFAEVTAPYDANGHYARVQPANINLFTYNQATGDLQPQPESQQFTGLQFSPKRRCPGAATQPAPDGSSPFLDGGNLGANDCDPAQVIPGP